ncbi:MAG: ribose 5-phosphate isomerase B [Planctomycetes bacterium]|nr:ribose 5-phosphate isomerase B [Planctomycetota bacterium]
MKVLIASDHAGLEGKRRAVAIADELGFEVEDLGPSDESSVDYPDFAHRVAAAVERGEARFGVLVCGTGLGMSMAANRHPGVRAAVITDELTAEMARAHNDANIACFGERVLGADRIGELLRTFLTRQFDDGRHLRRVEKIECPRGLQGS